MQPFAAETLLDAAGARALKLAPFEAVAAAGTQRLTADSNPPADFTLNDNT